MLQVSLIFAYEGSLQCTDNTNAINNVSPPSVSPPYVINGTAK